MSSKRPASVPADLAREARDLIERVSRAIRDDPVELTVPRIHETTRALLQLVELLPLTFEQLANALEVRAKAGAICLDATDDLDAAARAAAADLRVVAGEADELSYLLAKPSTTLWSMSQHK
ncbi:hypothetical protein [Streptomyces sp. Tue6028]|uniref:hypothetical protein n=1 Tax=Streptomyces sp. Tue6028 TaxID=2036037 RepID=UPI003D74994D